MDEEYEELISDEIVESEGRIRGKNYIFRLARSYISSSTIKNENKSRLFRQNKKQKEFMSVKPSIIEERGVCKKEGKTGPSMQLFAGFTDDKQVVIGLSKNINRSRSVYFCI